ncbi:MAG: hypothetical protein JOZ15_12065, partial [Acidobacteria bacterium]|nr:hypothetical protein [Acidobacteriota bacterium]
MRRLAHLAHLAAPAHPAAPADPADTADTATLRELREVFSVIVAHNPVGALDDPSTADVLAQADLVAGARGALGIETTRLAVAGWRIWEDLAALGRRSGGRSGNGGRGTSGNGGSGTSGNGGSGNGS